MKTDEAVSVLNNINDLFGAEYENTNPMIAIKMAIEALKREQWIPVSEKLPEEDVPVLVQKNCSCLVDGHYGRAVGEYNGFKYWTVEDDFYAEPIAWMPLPEPYKESK